ncbi:MAG: phage polymerase-related protein, partial [Marmoricola sp.]|nr:phage polymerase-related protein [Marmoricola sp.]
MTSEPTPARPGASWWIPERLEPALVAMGVGDCQGCELHRGPGTGTARPAGDGSSSSLVAPGPVPARVVVVRAQPAVDAGADGDGADPVGQLLRTALEGAGVDPATTWTTYAVKHAGPAPALDPAHVTACAPWWHAELEMVRPRGVVLLGDEVAQALIGADHAAGLVRGRTA